MSIYIDNQYHLIAVVKTWQRARVRAIRSQRHCFFVARVFIFISSQTNTTTQFLPVDFEILKNKIPNLIQNTVVRCTVERQERNLTNNRVTHCGLQPTSINDHDWVTVISSWHNHLKNMVDLIETHLLPLLVQREMFIIIGILHVILNIYILSLWGSSAKLIQQVATVCSYTA